MNILIKNFIDIVEYSWKENLDIISINDIDNSKIKFTISSKDKSLNHMLFSTISSLSKLHKLSFHSISLSKDNFFIEVILNLHSTGFDLNRISYL